MSKWLRACVMNWAWKQWNSLSKSSITNSKHKPQARQHNFFIFIYFLTQLNKTKQKDRNLYTSPPNLNQTLSSMLKMILSNICLEWKKKKNINMQHVNQVETSKVRRRRCTLIKLIVINFNFYQISARTKENKMKQENKHKD